MINNKPLLHKSTLVQIQGLLVQPPQSILIIGPPGSGKRALSHYLAARLLGTDPSGLSDHPYFIQIVKPEAKKEIPIDDVRGLIRTLNLKAATQKPGVAQRLVYIKDAELLSTESQNALLKAIEEPPPKTVFILSASSSGGVLPTIASRSQKMSLKPVSLDAASRYFEPRYDPGAVRSAWSLSQGAVGLLAAILKDDANHPLKNAVEKSKQFLRMDTYDRLTFLESYSKDKAELQIFLDGLSRVLRELHQMAIANDKAAQAKKLLKGRQLVNKVLYSLNLNTSVRLVCLNLALKLSV